MFSTSRPRIAVFLGVGLLVTAQSGSAWAQFPAQRPGPAAAMVQPSGTIEGIVPGFLQIKSLTGQQLVLQLQENTTVHVTGTAKADVIGPGTFISFVAEVDKRRSEVQGKVGRLTLFTPSPERPPGAFPGGAVGAGLGADPFGANPAAQPPARGADAGPPVETFEIVGQIKGIDKSGKLTVVAPNPYFKPAVQIELTEEPEIDLDLSGLAMLRFVKPGDKVQARGRQVAPNVAQVTELTVQLAEPLTTVKSKEPKKKPTRRTTRSSRRKRGQPDEAAEPEEAAEAEKKKEGEQASKDDKADKEDE